ncbi:MAG: MaoC family dehydratase [Clostridiales bacterium]|nr:MaoC family dehydratase [Clostridiales bacterium]
MERQYQIFYPGVYSEAEKAAMAEITARLESVPSGTVLDTRTADASAIAKYAMRWDSRNPLYNDGAYAKKTKWGGIVALPCYIFEENIGYFPMLDDMADKFGDVFYYANDGGDVELFTPVRAGDELRFVKEEQWVRDVTDPNGDMYRRISLFGRHSMINQRNELVGCGMSYARNAMIRYTDGGPVPTELEKTFEWIDDIPAVHVTTEDEWEFIKDIWKNEKLRGADPLYWEDVKVGDEPATTTPGPVSDIDMIRLHGEMLMGMPDTRGWMEMGVPLLKDAYGQYVHMIARHYSYCRNPKSRAVFYNFTARNFILRMVSNWMGDDGFIRGFKWRFQNLFKCMSGNRPGEEFLNLVPYMKGKYVNRHGMEGDTPICKGYVTDKYIKDGEHLAELVCWAETLDGDVIQVVSCTVKLLSRDA